MSKKTLSHRYFTVDFAKFSRTSFFIEQLWWLLQIFVRTKDEQIWISRIWLYFVTHSYLLDSFRNSSFSELENVVFSFTLTISLWSSQDRTSSAHCMLIFITFVTTLARYYGHYVRIQSEYRKVRIRENSVSGYFWRSVILVPGSWRKLYILVLWSRNVFSKVLKDKKGKRFLKYWPSWGNSNHSNWGLRLTIQLSKKVTVIVIAFLYKDYKIKLIIVLSWRMYLGAESMVWSTPYNKLSIFGFSS